MRKENKTQLWLYPNKYEENRMTKCGLKKGTKEKSNTAGKRDEEGRKRKRHKLWLSPDFSCLALEVITFFLLKINMKKSHESGYEGNKRKENDDVKVREKEENRTTKARTKKTAKLKRLSKRWRADRRIEHTTIRETSKCKETVEYKRLSSAY